MGKGKRLRRYRDRQPRIHARRARAQLNSAAADREWRRKRRAKRIAILVSVVFAIIDLGLICGYIVSGFDGGWFFFMLMGILGSVVAVALAVTDIFLPEEARPPANKPRRNPYGGHAGGVGPAEGGDGGGCGGGM
ncbi:hypothetical protein [Amycolatopsis nigrescens]|uniref:hypothetical protein n=1 Tax=Amycolatopsis nigrescens TaxID=381445 RepID=UPI0012F7E9A7|nr:hypothetical protein [Amycolatopsis nigrescens]